MSSGESSRRVTQVTWVCAGGEPGRVERRRHRVRRGGDDCRPDDCFLGGLDRLDVQAELVTSLGCEAFAVLSGGAEDAHRPEVAYLGDGFEVGLGHTAGADQP
jgi:hypothetical protein